MGLFGKTRADKFKEAHRVTMEKEPLLCYGAVMMTANDQPADTLDLCDNIGTQLLRDAWGINSAEEARITIEWLISQGDRSTIEPLLQEYHLAKFFTLNDAQRDAVTSSLKDMVGTKVRGKKITNQQISRITSGLVWDIERAAFVARLAHDAGFLTEKETWEVLGRCKKIISGKYETWTDYLIEYILGRSVIMAEAAKAKSYTIFYKSCMLIENGSSLWALYLRP